MMETSPDIDGGVAHFLAPVSSVLGMKRPAGRCFYFEGRCLGGRRNSFGDAWFVTPYLTCRMAKSFLTGPPCVPSPWRRVPGRQLFAIELGVIDDSRVRQARPTELASPQSPANRALSSAGNPLNHATLP